MKVRYSLVLITVIVYCIGLHIGNSWADVINTIQSDASSRTALKLVIYNQNFGLVKETRQMDLPLGHCRIYLKDISPKIEPDSVIGKSLLTDPDQFRILSQQYRYNLITPQNLLKAYVGKDIKLYFENPFSGQKQLVTAHLLAYNHGKAVCSINGQIFLKCPGLIILPQLPSNLFSQPTLIWEVNNDMEGTQLIQLSYLTEGLSWKANYSLILSQKEEGELNGWVNIRNDSGLTYPQAQVDLMAGEVHRSQSQVPFYKSQFLLSKSPSANVTSTPFFEYHLYHLSQPLTLENHQTTQVQFLQKGHVGLKQIFWYQGQSYYYRSYYDTPITSDKVKVFLEMSNSSNNGLGIPLPPGKIKVYQSDSEGNLFFIGEDQIKPTPIGETIKLNMGVAFDVSVKRVQTLYQRLSTSVYEIGWQISLKNAREYPVTIQVNEKIPGDWQVVSSNFEYQKTDAHSLHFEVPVPSQGETQIKYTVKIKQ